MILKSKILFLLTFSIYGLALGQNSLSSTGGTIESITGNVSFAVGQVFYDNFSDDNGSINEGIIQIEELPNEVLGFEGYSDFSISVFPNPTVNKITINWEESDITSINYQLINQNGQVLIKGVLDFKNHQIDLSNLASSLYYLTIANSKNQLKKFKIVKSY